MDPCASCPIRGGAEPCVAVRWGHPPICTRVAEGREDFVAFVLRGGRDAGAPAEPDAPAPAPRFDPAAHRRILKCTSRQSPKGCGCSGQIQCFRSGLPVVVDLARCLECPVAKAEE